MKQNLSLSKILFFLALALQKSHFVMDFCNFFNIIIRFLYTLKPIKNHFPSIITH